MQKNSTLFLLVLVNFFFLAMALSGSFIACTGEETNRDPVEIAIPDGAYWQWGSGNTGYYTDECYLFSSDGKEITSVEGGRYTEFACEKCSGCFWEWGNGSTGHYTDVCYLFSETGGILSEIELSRYPDSAISACKNR